MPCYSRIRTKMTDEEKLKGAMGDLGYTMSLLSDVIEGTKDGRRIVFQKTAGAYMAAGDTTGLKAIQMKYAEIGVRSWAKSRGFSVLKSEDSQTTRKMVLVNRRG